jgi:hypothetical protein
MLSFTAFCQVQIGLGRLLRFLDESMKQNQAAFGVRIEEHAGDSILGQAGSHFEDPAAQRSAKWHTDGLSELHGFDVLSDSLSVLLGVCLEPFAHRLAARLGAVEDGRDSLARFFSHSSWSNRCL